MLAMYRFQVCVEFIFDPSKRLMQIGVLAIFIFFTGVPGGMKCPVDPVSDMAYYLDSCIAGVEYVVSICL